MKTWRRFWRGPIFRMLVPCVIVGCATGATPETQAIASKLPQHFKQVRLEGKSWSDHEWDVTLRAWEAEACTLETFVRTGTIAAGTTKRCRTASKE